MKSVAVYCGSSLGNEVIFQQIAEHVGQVIAEHQLTLVYGGGNVGLMKIIADSALAYNGKVIGIMTEDLVKSELKHSGLTQLHIVKTMHQRKQMMSDLADGFIALPGGTGTLDEIYEQWTWAQLGIHQKPCAFLDVKGYYQPLFAMIEMMLQKGFIKETYAEMLIRSDNILDILTQFKHYQPPKRKW